MASLRHSHRRDVAGRAPLPTLASPSSSRRRNSSRTIRACISASVMTNSSAGRGGFFYMVVCLLLALVASARNYRRLDSGRQPPPHPMGARGADARAVPFIVLLLPAPPSGSASARFTATLPIVTWAALHPGVRSRWRSGRSSCSTSACSSAADCSICSRARRCARCSRCRSRCCCSRSSRNPDRTVAQILTQGSGWMNLVLIGAIAAALQSRQRLQTSLDRRFFPRGLPAGAGARAPDRRSPPARLARGHREARERAHRVGPAPDRAAHLLPRGGAQRTLRRPFLVGLVRRSAVVAAGDAAAG